MKTKFRCDATYNNDFEYKEEIEHFFDDETYQDLLNGKSDNYNKFNLQRFNPETNEYQDCDMWGDFI